jgi:hypothetical protein
LEKNEILNKKNKIHCKFIPLLFIKVVGKNLRFHIHYLEAIINIWELLGNFLAWAIRLVEDQVPPFKFYFVKNGTV